MSDIATIEELARAYRDARQELTDEIDDLQEVIDREKRRRMVRIRALVQAAGEERDRLKAAIEAAPGCFEKPRTQTFHGVKVGYQKAKGELVLDDEAQVVKRIRRHFPDRFDDLVKTTEKPLKAALAKLAAAELKKLGGELRETGDEVVIKPADGEVDKMVDALLADADRQDTGEGEAA